MTRPRCEPALAGFLRAILAASGDDTARLVLADFLEERGDKRGPVLREKGNWRRWPSRRLAPLQSLVWRTEPGAPTFAVFEYRWPFPRCVGEICVRYGRKRPPERVRKGKWLCASCYSHAGLIETLHAIQNA